MGLFDFLARLVKRPDEGHGVAELARRLAMNETELLGLQPVYREFTIPKRSGGQRRILAPDDDLKRIQRRILRRLLGRLRCHPAATGFERRHSIVTNALPHVGQPVVVRMDLQNFFEATSAKRVEDYFRRIGWNKQASKLLTRLCTHSGGLPQGAPTSPRLSNLVNYRLDARLAALAAKPAALGHRNPRTGEIQTALASVTGLDVCYTRYADDLTFSFSADLPTLVRLLIRCVKKIVRDEGYELHLRRKLHIRRAHDRQLVTGLVVNARVNLPREVRRWLRAVEHHVANGRSTTLSPTQLEGWRTLRSMVAKQSAP